MFETMPLRRPRHGTEPTPRMVRPSSPTSPTTAQTLVVPMSRPTTISPWALTLFMTRQLEHGRRERANFRAVVWIGPGGTLRARPATGYGATPHALRAGPGDRRSFERMRRGPRGRDRGRSVARARRSEPPG